MIGDSNEESNFPYKVLLTDREVSKLRQVFPNNSSVNLELSKTQLSKIVQLGRFLGRQTSQNINKSWFTFNEKCT